jgi:signal transduction histidine kinase
VRDPLEGRWPWCRRRADFLVAGVLTGAAAVVLATSGLLASSQAVPATLCTLAGCGLLAGRRRWPVATAALGGVLIAVPELTRDATEVNDNAALSLLVIAVVFLYAYALGAHSRWAPSLLGLVPLLAGVSLPISSFNPLAEMITIGPWLGGLAVASRRRIGEQLELRARELEEERELFAVQSVRYERARIARELHDIVAHCVSLIVVQAGAGAYLARQDPDSAKQAFESISETARQADTEIERLVELLNISAPTVPPAGLRIVEELVRRVRASGLIISCRFSGESDDMSEQGAEAAYRLVQEAITNSLKHAPGAPIDVAVRGRTDDVEVEVVNRPPAGVPSGLEGAGGGHGLAGMRERAARCAGTFEAGPTAEGGWRVAACLPRHPAPSPVVRWP